jgi:hypothetical protein
VEEDTNEFFRKMMKAAYTVLTLERLPVHDFIEVYPQVLSDTLCEEIVAQFEQSGQATRGRTGSGVDTKLKDSYDVTITGRPDWKQVVQLFNTAVFGCLKDYLKKYRFALIGPLALRYQDHATGQIALIDTEVFDTLDDETFTQLVMHAFRSGSINLQKYLADQGGYPHWHSEQYPLDSSAETLYRVLLWTIYLNPVPAAGETEFFYQNRKIAPEAGSVLIAPAGFTHTHRGNRPQGGDKYIATSWILFQRAEHLFPRS